MLAVIRSDDNSSFPHQMHGTTAAAGIGTLARDSGKLNPPRKPQKEPGAKPESRPQSGNLLLKGIIQDTVTNRYRRRKTEGRASNRIRRDKSGRIMGM